MRRRHGGTGLHSLPTCGNEATTRCRGLFPRCASCGNAGPVQAVALRLKINRSLREGLRGWGRGLSLLLYSPAQDGKHIKCFPLRAELATNLTPAPSPGDPPCRHFVRVVVVPRRFAARRPRSPRRGLSKDLAEALPLAQMETGDASASPVFVAVSPSQ